MANNAGKWRKKTVLTEAMQFDGTREGWAKIREWAGGEAVSDIMYLDDVEMFPLPKGKTSNTLGFVIKRYLGVCLVRPTDYVFRCNDMLFTDRPDMFEQAFERVE